MKCPKCHKEVKRGDKYCVHCGAKLIKIETSRQRQQKRPPRSRFLQRLPVYMLIIACALMPFAYLRAFPNSSLNPFASQTTTTTAIGDIKENAALTTVAVYKSTDAFRMNVSNASTFLEPIEAYVASLNDEYGQAFTTQYKIWVLRNNDVVIRSTSTAILNDSETLTITRRYNRTKTSDTIKEVVRKNNCATFDDLCLYDQEELLNAIMGSNRCSALHTAFLEKAEDFEKTKESIGHYGLGAYVNNVPDQYGFNALTNKTYTGKVSQVIYRSDDSYYVKVTHHYNGDYSLAR